MHRCLAKVLGAAVRQADILRCKPSFMYMNMHVRIPVQTSLHVHDRAFSSRAPIDDSVKMAPTPDREALQG